MYVEIVNKFIFIEVYVSNESLYIIHDYGWLGIETGVSIESFAWAAVCFQIIISTVEVMTLSQLNLTKHIPSS